MKLDNLKPGKSSAEGFLSASESFNDVVRMDGDALKRLGLQYNQFADRLLTIMEKANRKTTLWVQQDHDGSVWEMVGKGIIVEGQYKVTYVSYMGYQDCPFGCEGREASSDSDFTVINMQTGESIFFSELHPHLIREHHFFEGHTKYRLNPEQCARVLNIQPGVDYAPQFTSKEYWVEGSSHFSSTYKTVDDYVAHEFFPDAKRVISAGTLISLSGNKKGWRKNDQLYIVSLDKPSYGDIVVDGIPVRRMCEGAALYSRKVLKWVDDFGEKDEN